MAQDINRKLNKKMIERIIIIHNLIKSGVYPNIEHIRKYYLQQTGYEKVGVATIYRDIQTLQVQFKAPLEFDRQKNGYYYMDDDWDFALNNISEQDIFYLSSAKTLLSNFQGTPLYEEIASVIDFVTDTQMSGKSKLLNRVAIPPAPKVNIPSETWKIVMSALQNNTILEFDYNGRWNTKTTHRMVHPYQILLEDGMYFLFGWDENANDDKSSSEPTGGERLFCLNRISNLQALKETFELPENFNFTSRCSGGKFGAFITGIASKYKIEFYGNARQYVKDCIWADDQKITDDNDRKVTTITFSSAQYLKVQEWVLAQGKNSKPLEPAWFVDKWKKELIGMMKNAEL